jgi:membrane glycosyltransferase
MIMSLFLLILSGILGYILILFAYKNRFGCISIPIVFKNLISILLGPVAIILGLSFLYDIYLND